MNTSRSSLNSSISSVESKTKYQPQKKGLASVSSKAVINSSLSDNDDDSKVKLEVRVILENNPSKRKKVNKSTRRKVIDKERSNDTDSPHDLTETTDLETTLTDQEMSDPSKNRRSNRRSVRGASNTSTVPVKENKRKIEQVNIVSSSTGDIGQESEVPGEDTGCRTLRSRNVKKTNLDLGRNDKEKGRTLNNTTETVLKDDELEQHSTKKSVVVGKLEDIEKGSFYRKRGKILQVIKEETDDDQQDTDDPSFEPVNRSGKRRKNVITKRGATSRSKSNLTDSNNKSNNSKASDCSKDVDDHWCKEEKDRLME